MAKVLYLCDTLAVGGAEQLLLTTLKFLNRDRYYSIVYCIGKNGGIGEEIEGLGIKTQALNRRLALWNLAIVWKLIQVFRKEKPDILHCHLFYANCFGRVASLFVKRPLVIITEHGTYSNFKKFYHHWIDFILSLFTNRIVAVSKSVRDYLLKYTLISKEKITVIYNAVDFRNFEAVYNEDNSLIRRRLGFDESEIFIGSVANLAPWKGQDFLLQAFSDVVKVFPQARLCLVGGNNAGFQNKLEALARDLRITERVYFLGERRDIPQLMKTFDVFISPSLTEGLGISLLEAMYMGLPSIASDVEGLAELIEDNSDGLLVPPADNKTLSNSIIELLKDKDKMRRLGYNARKKALRLFSPEEYVKKLEPIYFSR